MSAARWGEIVAGLPSGGREDTALTGGIGQVRKGATVPGYPRSSVTGMRRARESLG
jgi:hypothetical protein